MALTLTPEMFVDLMRICFMWEWENAEAAARRSHNRERPLHATQLGWSTIDKVVRILHGLEVVSAKQRSLFYKDTRLQFLVLRNSEKVAPGEDLRHHRSASQKSFLLIADHAKELNRAKMMRNMRFFITERGRYAAESLAPKYAHAVSKDRYFAEIARQEENAPASAKGKAKMMHNYDRKVAEET